MFVYLDSCVSSTLILIGWKNGCVLKGKVYGYFQNEAASDARKHQQIAYSICYQLTD